MNNYNTNDFFIGNILKREQMVYYNQQLREKNELKNNVINQWTIKIQKQLNQSYFSNQKYTHFRRTIKILILKMKQFVNQKIRNFLPQNIREYFVLQKIQLNPFCSFTLKYQLVVFLKTLSIVQNFFHEKYKFLMLYDLEKRKMVFSKKITFFSEYQVEQILSISQNLIIMTSFLTIECYSLQGEEKFSLNRDLDRFNIHVKLSEQFFIIANYAISQETNITNQLKIFYSQNMRKIKQFVFLEKYKKIFGFSQNLLFLIPSDRKFLIILKELSTNKIIRRYKAFSNSDSNNIILSEINDNRIIGYDVKCYHEINISNGSTQTHYRKFPDFALLMYVKNKYGEPYFIQNHSSQKSVWKKNHSKNIIEVKIYKVKV